MKGVVNSAYHNYPVSKYKETNAYDWIIKINKLKSSWTGKIGKMVIGIDSSNQQHTNTNFASKINKHFFYGMDSSGQALTNDIYAKCIIHKKNYTLAENEIVRIELRKFNMKNGILTFHDEKEVICAIEGIDLLKTYHFAASLYQVNDEMCLMDFVAYEFIIEQNERYILQQNMTQNHPVVFNSILIRENGILSVDKWNIENNLGGILNIVCMGNILLETNAKIELNGKGYAGGRGGGYSGHSWKGK
eukprot:300809_1